jgi:hypothetical protein
MCNCCNKQLYIDKRTVLIDGPSVCLVTNHQGMSHPKYNSTFCPHSTYDIMCFMCYSKWVAFIYLNISNLVSFNGDAVFSLRQNLSLLGPTQSQGVWRNRYNEDIYKLFDDVALSTPEQTSVGWPHNKDGWVSYPPKSDGRIFWRK